MAKLNHMYEFYLKKASCINEAKETAVFLKRLIHKDEELNDEELSEFINTAEKIIKYYQKKAVNESMFI